MSELVRYLLPEHILFNLTIKLKTKISVTATIVYSGFF